MRNWINLLESTEPTFVFDDKDDCWVFDGFGVHSELLGSPQNGLGVMTFSSLVNGRGNAEKALRWLKGQCPALHVYDPGQPEDESFAFWKHMCDKGLVDTMEDEDNNVIYREGDWADGWVE